MRIGMFAMSGIRVRDAELLRLGLTLPGFVERSKTIASLPSLGLLTLAGMTPARHEIEYIEMPELPKHRPLPTGFDLVAISSFSAQIDEAYELARRYKAIGTPTVIGGPHVSALPEEAAEYCDAVVIGEGELSWERVLLDAERGRLQSRYDAGGQEFDLAQAPMPAFELLDMNRYNRITVQTSRGCPHRCEFCASSPLLTKRYKQKPVGKVIEELDRILATWDRPFIEFADDNSFVDRVYWKELLRALRGKGIKWFAETDLSVARDEELLDLLRDAGCAQLLIGLESPGEVGLRGIELHNDWKLRRFPEYKQAIHAIQSRGISVNGCFILGLDGHTPDIFERVLSFVREVELHEVQVTIMTPFPGTPLYDRLAAEGRLIDPRDWRKCTLFDINFQPSDMSVRELRDRFHELVLELYSDEFTNWRRNKFKRFLRRNRQPQQRIS